MNRYYCDYHVRKILLIYFNCPAKESINVENKEGRRERERESGRKSIKKHKNKFHVVYAMQSRYNQLKFHRFS